MSPEPFGGIVFRDLLVLTDPVIQQLVPAHLPPLSVSPPIPRALAVPTEISDSHIPNLWPPLVLWMAQGCLSSVFACTHSNSRAISVVSPRDQMTSSFSSWRNVWANPPEFQQLVEMGFPWT